MSKQAPSTQASPGSTGWIAPVVVLVGIAAAAWYLLKPAPPAPVVVAPVTTAPAPVENKPAEPADKLTPAPTGDDKLAEAADDAGVDVGAETEVAAATPLPSLDQSDEVVRAAFFGLKWQPGLSSLFLNEEMIRRFVVQVDNIAQGRLIAEQALFKGLSKDFAAKTKGQGYQLDKSNYLRYQPYLDLLESVPPQQVAALYKQFYPLLQAAYQELGYPEQQFDDRLQQAIKVLLSAPEISDEPDLTLSSVHYSFADAELEQLGLAQKQMIRLGQANQQRLKLLLVQYQAVLKR
jgi:tetratricopeptide (TPR) repeat protein